MKNSTRLTRLESECVRIFQQTYHCDPRYLVNAPGRVNLIGEHTDYNDGYVLPAAINRFACIALEPLDSPTVTLYSSNLEKKVEFSLDSVPRNGQAWERYLLGVAGELIGTGKPVRGWKGVIISDVPIGAGLSSSAAVEMGYVSCFAAAASERWDPKEMALIGQKADKNWVGIASGIMDHLISAAGVKDHALLIDCQSLDLSPVPMLPDHSIVIMDTRTRRQLVDSTYNTIRLECEEAARWLGGESLRDVQDTGLSVLDSLPVKLQKRVRHVLSENDRTLRAVRAFEQADHETVGSLMYASHCSLRDDYEVSCESLDAMVECAMRFPGCAGARMTGAGFGGCAVALVRRTQTSQFIDEVKRCYSQETGRLPDLFEVSVSSGASYRSL